ncbi:MAG: redoxin family protein [Phycisphaerales bacterium]|nr:redoxin family protein [Phycisphaerales bacterium]
MKRGMVAMAAALVMAAGMPAVAQEGGVKTAQPAKAREVAPGVKVERIADLQVGDKAPELKIAEWVKGDPVTSFEKGRVYVVEFWATWCGPCIAGMPHLSELQKEYKSKDVRIIGVNIWDDTTKVAPFMADKGGDEKMQYTVAIEEKIPDTDARRTGWMAKEWMEASGQQGIPSAFIVDQKGFVAWIGHPMTMDEPLKEIVAGEWDIAKAAKKYVDEKRVEVRFSEYMTAIRSGNTAKAYGVAKELIEGPAWDNAQMLNTLAWYIVDPDAKVEPRDAELGLKIAERASELTKHENAMILDTYAWALWFAGQQDKALEVQEKAVALAPANMKEQLSEALERMKKMKSGG